VTGEHQEAGAEEAPRLNGAAHVLTSPLPLDQLWAMRTDYEDVPVPSLGGVKLRVYALSGTARAHLVPAMAALADGKEPGERIGGAGDSPENIERVLLFQGHVVGASLGYPESQWDALPSTLGAQAIEDLYAVASRLSALDASAQAKATARLPRKRSAEAGSD
jgi:hypothetical protein